MDSDPLCASSCNASSYVVELHGLLRQRAAVYFLAFFFNSVLKGCKMSVLCIEIYSCINRPSKSKG